MGYSIKYLNNTSSPVALTITSSDEATGYLGSVSMAAYSALTTSNDIAELDVLAGLRTIDKYVNSVKVYYPGKTGYLGTFGAAGYTGSVGAVGYKGSAA